MPTKYITIKIPVPSLNWFGNKKAEYESQQYDFGTAEIKARIAALRNGIVVEDKPSKVSQTQSKYEVAEAPQQQRTREDRTQEMNDIKAKLLGKKT